MASLIRERLKSPRTIGIEKDYMTVRFLENLQGVFPQGRFGSITRALDEMRAIKTPEEVRCLEESNRHGRGGDESRLGRSPAGRYGNRHCGRGRICHAPGGQ